jgi:hypothetical protein
MHDNGIGSQPSPQLICKISRLQWMQGNMAIGLHGNHEERGLLVKQWIQQRTNRKSRLFYFILDGNNVPLKKKVTWKCCLILHQMRSNTRIYDPNSNHELLGNKMFIELFNQTPCDICALLF